MREMIPVAALRPRSVVGVIGHLTNLTVVSFSGKELIWNAESVIPRWAEPIIQGKWI